MNWFLRFKVNGEVREFMYLYDTDCKEELKPLIAMVKGQGDMYRITKYLFEGRTHYEMWDARR